MKLYQFPFSPSCQKVVAVAHEVGVPLDLATVDLFFALQVLGAKDGRIRVIDHFTTGTSLAAFFAGGLARTLAATPG